MPHGTREQMSKTMPHEELNSVIRQHSEVLAAQLHAQRASMFPPDASKTMRKFTSGEAAAMLGVNDSYLRKLHLEGKGPTPETTPGSRRLYSAGMCAPCACCWRKPPVNPVIICRAVARGIICK